MRRLFVALSLLSIQTPGLADGIDFKKQVYPILTRHCTKCHGEKKQAGELQLHLPSAIDDFGVVAAGDPDGSSLFERITLPEDDEMSMPKGAAPLSETDIEVIRKWIEEGASMPADDDVFETIEEKYQLPVVEPATPEAIANVEATGAAVIQLYAGSPLLQVSFAHSASPATDGSLEALAGVAKQVVSLNLARSEVTNDGLAAIAQLENLMRLHLENTHVTDPGLVHLAKLSRLDYLNLYGTKVSDAGLAHLKGLTNLRKLFLWQSDVTYASAMALQDSIDGLEVNLGWDHPDVKKAREARMAELAAARAPDETPAEDEQPVSEEAGETPKQPEPSDPPADAPSDKAGSDGPAEPNAQENEDDQSGANSPIESQRP